MRHDGTWEMYLAIVERLRGAASVELRHDLCGGLTLDHALAFAQREAAHGLRATYYVLHPERYSGAALGDFTRGLADCGHELGLHHASIAAYLKTGVPPADTLRRQLDLLRQRASVTRTAAHGSPECYTADGRLRFVEYEVFSEFDPARNVGAAMRWPFARVSAKELGLVETYLHGEHNRYLSDSAGSWRGWRGDHRPRPFERVGGAMAEGTSALDDVGPEDRVMLLTHPCYWRTP